MSEDLDKELVPNSVRTVSSNVYVSKGREWIFYNWSEIFFILRKIDETIEANPKYLLSEEIDFLKTYSKEFNKHRVHNQFKLATSDYIVLLNSALDALNSRLMKEEQLTIDKNEYSEIKGQIVLSFTQISSLFKDLQNTFFNDLDMIQQNPKKYEKIIKYLLASVNYLLRAYFYEYSFFKEPKEISFEELIEFNSSIDKTYIDFNRSEFASPKYKLTNQIYEIYA